MRHDVVGACALDCPDTCSWVVTVDDGQAVKLAGNPAHPFTRGGLCAKVNPYLEYAAAPDRLLFPLRRVGPKGSGKFERISWSAALTEIATRLAGVIESDGPQGIWPFIGTGSIGLMQGQSAIGQRLFNILGASIHDCNICSVSGHVGMSYTTGSASGMDPADLEHSALVLLWGTNTLTTNLHLWRHVTKARGRGASLVVIDPVRTRTAAQADRHIAPKPGTDGALALGVIAELVRMGAVDETYVATMTHGWAEFRDQELAGWSVQRAAEICGLEVAEVQWLADAIGSSRPTGIRSLMGVQRHGGGAQALRAISMIPAVTGDFARVGGGIVYSTSDAYGFNEDALLRPDLAPPGERRVLRMTSLGRELLERKDPPVQALVVWAANPVLSNPDQNRTREGLAREDLFTVVVDHVHTETSAYADIVLPGTTQLEHAELHDSYSHLFVNWNEPAIAPPGECRSHNDIFRGLATAMGLTEPELYTPDDDLVRDALSGTAPQFAGVTLERLKAEGFVRLSVPDPYLPFAEEFPTPSGRFEFSSDRGAGDAAGRFPHFVPPHEALGVGSGRAAHAAGAGSRGIEVSLISAANHYLTNSVFTASPLHRKSGEVLVSVHPRDADLAGLAEGEVAIVGNERGEFRAVVRITTDVRPGLAASSKGIGSSLGGGSSVNVTTADRDSDLGHGATYHDNRVFIRSART